MVDRVDPDDPPGFGKLGDVLRERAAAGHGFVLGLAPAGRSGIVRVSTAAAEEFEQRLAAAFQDRFPALVRYATRKLSDRTHAEDVVQRAFEKLLRRHRRVQEEITNLHAYLQTAVCNEINRELRVLIPAREAAPVPDEGELPSPATEVATRVADGLDVQAALRVLAPREREAVVLRVQWELTVAEAAEVMGVSAGAVKRYTSDGLQRLRERLGLPA